MSTTPAAELARLKNQFARWQIRRTANGLLAVHRGTGERVTEPTLASLERSLTAHPGSRAESGNDE